MGAVSCRKIALAAVVSLVAMTKVNIAPANPKPPASVSNDTKKRGFPRKGNNTAAANRLRNPDIDMGDHETSLINRPLVLQIKVTRTMRSRAFRFDINFVPVFQDQKAIDQ